jgi:hypothetical protein
VALAAAALSLSVSACGLTNRKEHPTVADGEQLYVDAGPITYQVQITRELNPYSTEDAQYLAGVSGAQTLPSSQLWFAVFLRALNQSGHTQTTTNSFQIVDSEGTVYHPVALNPSVNPYAWTSMQLQPNAIEPNPDSTAAYGPTQGGLILFKLNDSIFSNRPLTLDISAPGQAKPTTVSLDL